MNMPRVFLFVGAVSALSLFSMLTFAPTAGAAEGPKNIIVIIGDGCGFNHIEAIDDYQYGEKGKQVYEKDYTPLAMSTYPEGGSYDPSVAWTDPAYLTTGATDSAAAATAMATGRKTLNGHLGQDLQGNPVENLVEKAEKQHRATGVVTTVLFPHATPAGFTVHNTDRGEYKDIAQYMIESSGLEVLMGSGHPWYDDNGKAKAPLGGKGLPEGIPEKDYNSAGGAALWGKLLDGTAGGDCDGDGKPDAWTLVQTREGFQKLAQGAAPKRVMGIAPVGSTLRVDRAPSDADIKDDLPGQVPVPDSIPTLAEMTKGALHVLEANPNGFFLMVECGAIDWASHENALGRMIEEGLDLNATAEAVQAWVETKGRWEDTLVIITADHETGCLTGTTGEGAWKPIQSNGAGKMPSATYAIKGHTNNLVPFFVKGKGSEKFVEAATHEDPKRGKYLDNTDMGRILGDFLQP